MANQITHSGTSPSMPSQPHQPNQAYLSQHSSQIAPGHKSSDQSESLYYGKNPRSKNIKKAKNYACGHHDKRHYAKVHPSISPQGMCHLCYQRQNRKRKPKKCPHKRLYAYDRCFSCYRAYKAGVLFPIFLIPSWRKNRANPRKRSPRPPRLRICPTNRSGTRILCLRTRTALKRARSRSNPGISRPKNTRRLATGWEKPRERPSGRLSASR